MCNSHLKFAHSAILMLPSIFQPSLELQRLLMPCSTRSRSLLGNGLRVLACISEISSHHLPGTKVPEQPLEVHPQDEAPPHGLTGEGAIPMVQHLMSAGSLGQPPLINWPPNEVQDEVLMQMPSLKKVPVAVPLQWPLTARALRTSAAAVSGTAAGPARAAIGKKPTRR
jgi:hypothetical protein